MINTDSARGCRACEDTGQPTSGGVSPEPKRAPRTVLEQCSSCGAHGLRSEMFCSAVDDEGITVIGHICWDCAAVVSHHAGVTERMHARRLEVLGKRHREIAEEVAEAICAAVREGQVGGDLSRYVRTQLIAVLSVAARSYLEGGARDE